MRKVAEYNGWTLVIRSIRDTGMYTAKATISRDEDSYEFSDLGVADTEERAIEWASRWLRNWLDENE
jgi:hypothetical protein